MSETYRGIQDERVVELNDHEVADGRYVGYWMQQSQRAEFNPALEYAVHRANELKLPLVVAFGLMNDYPEANLRHYHFLLQGLADVERSLAKRKITFVVRRGAPDDVALELASDAALLVCDRGYLRHQRRWREKVAEQAPCLVVQVEGDVVVPVELASDKLESAARTIRPKITGHLERFLVDLPAAKLREHHPAAPRDGRGPVRRRPADRPAETRPRRAAGAAVHRRYDGRQGDTPGLPGELVLRLRQEPQPAADRRRLTHEQVPAFRSPVAGVDRTADQGAERADQESRADEKRRHDASSKS